MVSLGSFVPKPNNSTGTGNKLFVDDDEETLSLLISKQESNLSDDFYSGFISRFVEDQSCHQSSDAANGRQQGLWESWNERLRFLGVSSLYTSTNSITIRSSDALQSAPLPATLESHDGQLHLEATCSILSIPKIKAIQLTLATMQSLDLSSFGDATKCSTTLLQTLVGTRVLLERVVEYHYKQRLARISLITEFLRIENQQNNTDDMNQTNDIVSAITSVLDSLDQQTLIAGKKRGLFQMLLMTICSPDISLSWNQMQPTQNLRWKSPLYGEQNNDNSIHKDEWKQFMRDAINQRLMYYERERQEAMEALLVLLYHRLECGVNRTDLTLILITFESLNFFKPSKSDSISGLRPSSDYYSTRLPKLAALILVEAMNLWKIVDTPRVSKSTTFVTSHPLFTSPNNDNVVVVENEIQILVTIINQCCSSADCQDVPEALALLAFGILLYSAGQRAKEWSALSTTGLDLLTRANTEFDAFGYLQSTLDALYIPVSTEGTIPMDTQGIPSDLQQFAELQQLQAKSWDCDELSAPSLAYASVGRELLIATIHSLRPMLLPEHQVPLRDNVQLLSSLLACIFRNSPTLCEQFWTEWDEYTQSNVPTPLSALLQGAHLLASTDLYSNQSDEEILMSITPFLQIAASVSCSSDHVEVMVASMPNGLIGFTFHVLATRSATLHHSAELRRCRDIIIDAFSTLCTRGNSPKCRTALRFALERNESSGLNNFVRIITESDSIDLSKVFKLIRELMNGAPIQWKLDCIQCLFLMQKQAKVWQSSFTKDNNTIQSFALMIHNIILDICNILFHSESTEEKSLVSLSVIRASIQALSSCLITSLSKTYLKQDTTTLLSYDCAAIILTCLRSVLVKFKPIIDLHHSILVQNDAIEIRDGLVNELTGRRGLGESVFMYATAPATLAFAKRLESRESDSTILASSAEKGVDRLLGREYYTKNIGYVSSPASIASLLMNSVDDGGSWSSHLNDVDFDCVHAAYSAIRLLNEWSNTVDNATKRPDIRIDKLNELHNLSPHIYLGTTATLPRDLFGEAQSKSHYSSVNISKFTLLSVCLMRDPVKFDVSIQSLLTLEVLDFLAASVKKSKRHLQSKGEATDDSLYFSLYKSNTFAISLRRWILAFQGVENFSASDFLHATMTRRVIQILAAFVDCNPVIASKSLNLKDQSIVKVLVEGIKKSATAFKNFNVDPSHNSARVDRRAYLQDVMVRAEALSVFWETGRQLANTRNDYWQDFTDQNVDIISTIAWLIFEIPIDFSNSEGLNSPVLREKSLYLSVLSFSLTFLSREMSWMSSTLKKPSEIPVFAVFKKIVESSLTTLIYAFKKCCIMQCCQVFSDIQKQQKSYSCSHFVFHKCRSFIFNNYAGEISPNDADSIGQWLLHVTNSERNSVDAISLVSGIDLLNEVFVCEAMSLSSWKIFTQSLSTWIYKSFQDDSIIKSVSMYYESYSSEMLQEVLFVAHQNLLNAKIVTWNNFPSFLKDGILVGTKEMISLVLFLLHERKKTLGVFEVSKSLTQLCTIVEIISNVDIHDTNSASTVHRIFSVALVLLQKYPTKETFGNESSLQLSNCILNLSMCASKFVKSISNVSVQTGHHSNCLCTCISFLTSALEVATFTRETFHQNQHSLASKLVHEVQEHAVVQVVVRSIKSVPATTHSFDANEEVQNEMIQFFVTMSFLSTLASTGLYAALQLLGSSDAANILWVNEGNIESFNKTFQNFEGATKEQERVITAPLHAKMGFIAACLRSMHSLIQNDILRDRAFPFLKPALHFVRTHQIVILNALLNCGITNGRARKFLSQESLNDAFAVLTVLVELRTSNTLKEENVCLSTSIQDALLSLVAHLGNFLGASAAARDIFERIDSLKKFDASGADRGSSFASPISDQRLFAGGLQNFRHEAIRYSHHVSSLSRSAFPKSFGSSGSGETSSAAKSMSALEDVCRRIVAESFESMEFTAAKCVFLALQILWQTHPATNCFVLFSEDESTQLNAMSMVEPGAIIAVRHDSACRPLSNSISLDSMNLTFGKVIHSDTINRRWQVQVEERNQKFFVLESQLAGVEDLTKRLTILGSSHAPDSSTALETFGQPASVGHLILVLRWCCRSQTELQRSNDTADSASYTVFTKSLAELASLFLGTELSLRQEGQRGETLAVNQIDGFLARQIFDLFGEQSDFEGLQPNSVNRVNSNEGRLKNLLCDRSWSSSRNQLMDFIKFSVEDALLKALKPSEASHKNRFFDY